MSKNFYVGNGYRINDLYLLNGGFDVKIIFNNQKSRVYKNVHFPESFFNKAKLKNNNVMSYEILGKTKNKIYKNE